MLGEYAKKAAYAFAVEGKNKAEAYRASFPDAAKMNPKQVSQAAHKVFKSEAVKAEIERLKVLNEETEIITRSDLIRKTKELMDVARENAIIELTDDDGSVIKHLNVKAANVYVKAIEKAASLIGADKQPKGTPSINIVLSDELDDYAD